jgi:SAM-dependent methyltransferase
MHQTAMDNGRSFFSCYSKIFDDALVTVVEIGSQDVNGTLKDVCPERFKYIGVDFISAANVDVVLEDPYVLPFEDNSVDIVLSSSCFEHSEMFWLVFLEILRVLKPKGVFYMNAPSKGGYHAYPVDCWRFYPDSGLALNNWGKRNGYSSVLLESYTHSSGDWGDFSAVFLKDFNFINDFTARIIDTKPDFINGRRDSNALEMFKPAYSGDTERKVEGLSALKKYIPSVLMPFAKKMYDYFR